MQNSVGKLVKELEFCINIFQTLYFKPDLFTSLQKHSEYVQARYEFILIGLFFTDEFIRTQGIKIARFKFNVLCDARIFMEMNSLLWSQLNFPVTYVYQLSFLFVLHFVCSLCCLKWQSWACSSCRLTYISEQGLFVGRTVLICSHTLMFWDWGLAEEVCPGVGTV